MKKGLFIVLEGIDGSGKSTQLMHIAEYLFRSRKKTHIFLTREPYISPHYQEIRDLLKKGVDPKENGEQFTKLFVADRTVHASVINRHLEEGTHVICDRYKYSTLVYQNAQGMEMDYLLKMHEGLPIPDLAIFIDVPVAKALSRIVVDDARTHAEIFEKEDFLTTLRQGYLDLKDVLKDENIVVVNGEQSPEAVFEDIKPELERLL